MSDRMTESICCPLCDVIFLVDLFHTATCPNCGAVLRWDEGYVPDCDWIKKALKDAEQRGAEQAKQEMLEAVKKSDQWMTSRPGPSIWGQPPSWLTELMANPEPPGTGDQNERR